MMRSTMNTKAKKWERAAAVLLAILLWQLCATALGNRLLLASPAAVFQRLCQLSAEKEFYASVLFSFRRIVTGFLLGLLGGTLLAVPASRFRWAEILLWPYLTIVKTTPVVSFIILCMIWLEAKNLSVFISFLMVLPIIYTNMLEGIRRRDKKLLEMGQVFRLPPLRRLLFLSLPQLKPYLLSACSLSLGLSWKAGIAAEVIAIPTGSMGERLYEAKLYLSSADLFAWTVVLIAMSILFEKLFLWLIHGLYGRLERF